MIKNLPIIKTLNKSIKFWFTAAAAAATAAIAAAISENYYQTIWLHTIVRKQKIKHPITGKSILIDKFRVTAEVTAAAAATVVANFFQFQFHTTYQMYIHPWYGFWSYFCWIVGLILSKQVLDTF